MSRVGYRCSRAELGRNLGTGGLPRDAGGSVSYYVIPIQAEWPISCEGYCSYQNR